MGNNIPGAGILTASNTPGAGILTANIIPAAVILTANNIPEVGILTPWHVSASDYWVSVPSLGHRRDITLTGALILYKATPQTRAIVPGQ